LNLRPPGYEPGELPDCSTPRRGDKDSIGSMPWWSWIALVFFAVVVTSGTAVAVLAVLRMRRLGATGDRVAVALADLTHKTDELERRLERANERAELVERRIAQLNASMERLSVLTWAAGDVARTISHVRSAVTLRK
jgi:hypothetical protein